VSRKTLPLPPHAALRSLFDYDPKSGILVRKYQPSVPPRINRRCAGRPAGGPAKNGYVVVSIGRTRYLAHRLIWKLVHNTEPIEIDHRNLDRGDNSLSNLRPSTGYQNHSNVAARKTVTIDLPKGVYPNRAGNKFCSKIQSADLIYHLGSFDTPEKAHAAYCRAATKLHKDFARFY
tara:strand:- start:6 stop:533 length:528 start_codon:yes stop_codon:yes gene_type:complete